MRVRLVVSVCLATLVVAAASAVAATPPTVLVIGDSVATGMYWHDDAIAVMQEGLGVYWDVAICRTIDGTSCPFDGERAPTLIQVVSARGTVPPTVVVEVGYNDPAGTFATEVDHAMSALTAAGATHVLWLTMRESKAPYPTLNALLGKAEARWPQLELVDWNADSESHPSWFQTDDIHLTPEGGVAMAHLAHAAVMKVVDPLRVRSTPLRLQAGRPYALKLRAQGGTPSYRWRVASGRPPRGFHLLADGTLTTTAASVERATLTLAVTDADGTTASLQVLER
jgi:lysophospholipase L1-like esterase